MTHKGTVTLETERLILRRFEPNDADAMFRNWCNDPEVTRFLTWEPHGSIDLTRRICLSDISKYDDSSHYQWAIVPKILGEPIGGINIVTIDETCRSFGIAYRIGKAWWHQGFSSEALSGIIRFLFEQVDVNRIFAQHEPNNPNSGAVMRKCGMQYEGTMRQCFLRKEEMTDLVQYAILAEDYFNPQKANVTIIPYSAEYRDDMLFCFMLAKDAMGKAHNVEKPYIKPDLLDIEGTYLKRGDIFNLAIDKHDRVVGMLGTETVSLADLWLKRLFIKPDMKGRGIGSALLADVEKFAADKGITAIHTRFADWYAEAARFYPAKGFKEVEPHKGLRHFVKRLEIKG